MPHFIWFFCCQGSAAHRHLHSFPTRRSSDLAERDAFGEAGAREVAARDRRPLLVQVAAEEPAVGYQAARDRDRAVRSEEHTSELQSRGHLVCRLLLEKKKRRYNRSARWPRRR